jgi:5-methylthioadenosine/S-adenosylhomocysteine deaminase
MKLSSMGPLRFPDLVGAGVNVTLGTDGPASNNSQDMLQTMKVSALMINHAYGANAISPKAILDCATVNGYRALGIRGGTLEAGSVADLILMDPKHHSMTPGHDVVSNLVYSASPEAIRYTIVDGVVLMRDRIVEGEDRIVEEANEAAMDLMEA